MPPQRPIRLITIIRQRLREGFPFFSLSRFEAEQIETAGKEQKLNEAEFRAYAKAEGYREPEARSLPPNKLFDTQAHDEDLIVLITKGSFAVAHGAARTTFGPGEMCQVAAGVDHTDRAGPEGASYILAWRRS